MLKPDTALDSWREWDASLDTRPVVISPLGGGRSNRSFLLASDGEKMVLRINATPTALPNPNRGVEASVWRAASEAGIAPRLLYADPGGAFLVSAFVESRLAGQPKDDPDLAEQALALLRETHRLEVAAPEIDYAAHIEAYWQRIETSQLTVDPELLKQREPMRELLLNSSAGDSPQVLCHHDPVIENFVGAPERLYLVDWEYAARGLAVMDYAALGTEWGIDDDVIVERTGVDSASLISASTLYRYMCALWEAISISL